MKTTLTYLFILFFISLSPLLHAQLNYLPGGFSTSAGTYVDLGLNGDTIPLSNKDDAFSAPLPIGFTFNFNGYPYDSFVFSTNGFIKLGRDSASRHFLFTSMAQPPANGPFTAATSPAPLPGDTSMLFAFGQDLYPGPLNAEYRFYTDGAPGSRILTVQWKNVRDKLQAATGGLWDTINFQLKLYEGSNVVEYVYGNWTSTISLAVARFSAVGIVGNSVTVASQNIHLVKGSTVAWNAAVANTGFYVNNAVNYRNPTSSPAGPAPDPGRAYRFTPITLNDASVNLIYAQGRVSLGFSRFDSIRANIVNPGVNTLTNLTVTLTISGDHNYTTTANIPSLASGSNINVAFAPYMPAYNGQSIITVSVPNDDNLANNEKTYSYNVGDYRMTYGDTLIPHTGSNGTTIANFWGARFYINAPAVVTTVRSFLVINSDALGDTLAGLILDTLGNVIARSDNYIVQNSDLGTLLTFTMRVPVTVSYRTIIAGIAGGATVVPGINYFLGTSQTETPIRPNSPFCFMTQTAAGGITNLAVGSLYASPAIWSTTRLMMECEVRPIPQIDAIISAAAPASTSVVPTNTPIPLTAVVKNNGLGLLPPGITVRYRIGNGPIIGPINTSAFLNAGDTTSVVFSGANAITFSTPGTYTVKVFSTVANDSIPGNDTLVLTYNAQAPATLPYRIDNNILATWTVENTNPPLWKNGFAVLPNGTTNSNVLWGDNNAIAAGKKAKVSSPFFNFTGVSKPTLHFHVAHAPNTALGTDDTLEVLVSTDGGYSYNTVWMKGSTSTSPGLATDSATAFSYSPANSGGWRHEMVDLTAYSGSAFVQISFRVRSASGNGIYISNVTLTNPVSNYVTQVYGAGIYGYSNLLVTFNAIGAFGANLTFSKYSGAPPSTASPVFASNTTATTSGNALFTPDRVCQTEWYTITYDGTGPANPAQYAPYSVTIDASAIPGITRPDSVYIMQRSAYNGSWVPVTTAYGSPTFVSATLYGFSDFALGSVTSANLLPVSLLKLNGKSISNTQNLLTWSTASESNNSYFVIERSFDKISFKEAGNVKGSGTSTTLRNYSFTDEWKAGFRSDVYYRLKQVDLDGTETYSPVVVITAGNRTEVFVTNPFDNSPEIVVQHTESAVMQVMITDISGRTIADNNLLLERGRNQIRLNEFASLQSGVYFVRLKIGDGEWIAEKVVKK
jgi:hypothetical protein